MKSKQNKYSQLYAKIDRKQLSEQALATLDKLRLATGNFRTKNQESLDLFQEFYDKLSEKKPTAIKGSPENKAMIKEMLKERGRKLAEGRKAKQKEKTESKSQGNDIDANRPAKPFGWRMRGKHNYKKPTRADITEGRAYYEGRVNRADVKRKKYPMLERGGYMAEGGEIKAHNGEKYKEEFSGSNRWLQVDDKYKMTSEEHENEASKYNRSGNYELRDMHRKIAKSLSQEPIILKYGGYMAKGGDVQECEYVVKFQNQDSGDIEEISVMAESEKDAIQNAYDESGLSDDYKFLSVKKYIKGGYMSKGGETDEEGVDLFEDYDDQPQEVQDILEKYDFEDADYQTLKKLKKELNAVGYTFEYDMDGSPYDLRKIGQKGKSEFYAKGGTIGGMSTYVSARDIEEIKLTINGDMKTLKGSDLMDGVYVKKASLKAKFDAYEIYNKLSNMAYNVWDKLKIESGSEIYNSDAIQKKLQVEYEKAGIDSLFKSLNKTQRKKVAEILTDENQHSLRNYLALRGYQGEMEYNTYKDGYDNMPKGRKYYISPYTITRVVTMAEGGEVFYTEKHKND